MTQLPTETTPLTAECTILSTMPLYNARSGLALVCPITNQAKGYPFEVAAPAGSGANGVILADRLKSIDWKARHAERLGRCTR